MTRESQYDYERGQGPPREHNRWNQPPSMHPGAMQSEEQQVRYRSDLHADQREQPLDDLYTPQPRYGQIQQARQYNPGTEHAQRYNRGQEYASGSAPAFAQGGFPRHATGPAGAPAPSTYRPNGSHNPATPSAYHDPNFEPPTHDTSPYAGHVPQGAMPASVAQPGFAHSATGVIGGVRSYAGRGPKGYTRSDDRLEEDVNDVLTRDHHLDASDIEVSVENGEVTLSGAVCSRSEKFHAEQLADSVIGVRDVANRLRVDRQRPDDTPPAIAGNPSVQAQRAARKSADDSKGSPKKDTRDAKA